LASREAGLAGDPSLRLKNGYAQDDKAVGMTKSCKSQTAPLIGMTGFRGNLDGEVSRFRVGGSAGDGAGGGERGASGRGAEDCSGNFDGAESAESEFAESGVVESELAES